jgi:hypothetical protein
MGTDLTKSVKHTGNIPKKDSDFDDLGIQVLSSWAANPDLTLLWTNRQEFEASTSGFSAALGERQSTGSGRSSLSGELRNLDKAINKGSTFVKDYLNEKYGKENAHMYFANFGIVKIGDEYVIPYDHNKRSDALELVLAALITHGFGAKTYGTAYWQPIKTRFDELLLLAKSTDGTVASKVGEKNMHRKAITKTLNALIHLIRANYPDDWKNKIREWGFQKEKY